MNPESLWRFIGDSSAFAKAGSELQWDQREKDQQRPASRKLCDVPNFHNESRILKAVALSVNFR